MSAPPLEPVPANEPRATRGGFTLVELLVVMAVLTTLAALLLPVLARAREQARQSTCLSHLRQIGQAHLLYLHDWDDRFPNWWLPGPPLPPHVGIYHFWPELFEPYLGSEEILRDPTAVTNPPPIGEILADYILPTWGPGGEGTREDPYWCWAGPSLELSQVVRPTETLTVMDGFTTTEAAKAWVPRHSGGLNAVFVDGHAHWVRGPDFWRVESDGAGAYRLHYLAADR
jgi:prepilin-type N-terminal cleavage/methylation domain-containing protein/prepilin-type processing-associated H-X9-DG protein